LSTVDDAVIERARECHRPRRGHICLPLRHPDVNKFFTRLKSQPKYQIRVQVQAFMEVNPQVKADLQGIRRPSVDCSARCGGGE
jgi:hemophore-related protein